LPAQKVEKDLLIKSQGMVFIAIRVIPNISLHSEYFSSSFLSPVNRLGTNLRHKAQPPTDHLKFSFATNSFWLVPWDFLLKSTSRK
jgi:hypothetical protein